MSLLLLTTPYWLELVRIVVFILVFGVFAAILYFSVIRPLRKIKKVTQKNLSTDVKHTEPDSNKAEYTLNRVTFVSSIITVLSFVFPFYDDKMGLSFITGSSGLLLAFILQIGSILVFLNRGRVQSAGQTKRILLILNCISLIGLLAGTTDVIRAEHLTLFEVWPSPGYILAGVAATIASISVLTISKEPVGFAKLMWLKKLLVVLGIIVALLVTAAIELNPEKNAVIAYCLWCGQISESPSYEVRQITAAMEDWYVLQSNRVVAITGSDGNSVSTFTISLNLYRSKVGKKYVLNCTIKTPTYFPITRMIPVHLELAGRRNDASSWSLSMGKVELAYLDYYGFYTDYNVFGAEQPVSYKKLVELAQSSELSINCDFLENGNHVYYSAELSDVNKENIRRFCEQYQ